MGKESQKNALPTLFHFVRVRAALHPHVNGAASFFWPRNSEFSSPRCFTALHASTGSLWHWQVPQRSVEKLFVNLEQGRHNFSKTGGAAQKLGGQNIKNHLILTVFGVEFQGKWVKISKNWGGSCPPCHPPSDAPVNATFLTCKKYFVKTDKRTPSK